MKIVFAGTTLGDDLDDLPISARTVNGEAVSEAVNIVQAARKRIYARGNEAVTFQFSVHREFATIKEAELYWLTHWSLLPKSGLCTITCGQTGDTQDVLLANAVLTAAPQAACKGHSVFLQYTITAPAATTTPPVDLYIETLPMLLRDTTALTAGTELEAVVFSTPFAAAPVVTVSVEKPAAGSNVFATVRGTTINGFTVDFSAPIPAGGYLLQWIAIEQ